MTATGTIETEPFEFTLKFLFIYARERDSEEPFEWVEQTQMKIFAVGWASSWPDCFLKSDFLAEWNFKGSSNDFDPQLMNYNKAP